jgi:hypothetical protein
VAAEHAAGAAAQRVRLGERAGEGRNGVARSLEQLADQGVAAGIGGASRRLSISDSRCASASISSERRLRLASRSSCR